MSGHRNNRRWTSKRAARYTGRRPTAEAETNLDRLGLPNYDPDADNDEVCDVGERADIVGEPSQESQMTSDSVRDRLARSILGVPCALIGVYWTLRKGGYWQGFRVSGHEYGEPVYEVVDKKVWDEVPTEQYVARVELETLTCQRCGDVDEAWRPMA